MPQCASRSAFQESQKNFRDRDKASIQRLAGRPRRPPSPFNNLQVVKEAVVINQGAADGGGGVETLDFDQVNAVVQEGAKEAGQVCGVDGAEEGIEQMATNFAADEIVEGHQYFE